MSEFLVEAYFAPSDHDCGWTAQVVADAAERVTREGRPVRLVRTLLVPDDETCFYLFEAESMAAVVEAASRAGLRFERSSEALSAWDSGTRADRTLSESRSGGHLGESEEVATAP